MDTRAEMARLVRAALMDFIQPVQLLSVDANQKTGEVTGRFRSSEMVFDYRIKGEQVAYGPIGSDRTDAPGTWEERSRAYLMAHHCWSAERLDSYLQDEERYDASRSRRKKCGTGYNCGGTCISRAKDCRLNGAGSAAVKRLAALMGIEEGSPKAAMLFSKGKRPVAITTQNVEVYAGGADVSPLKGKSPQELARAFSIPPGFWSHSSAAMVPLDKLVVPKDELKDPRFQAGQKPDPRSTAAKRMGETISKPFGERVGREPIKVSDNGDGTYTVVDGNATVQALMLAKAKGMYLPVQVVAFKGFDSQLVADKEPDTRHSPGARKLAAGVRKFAELKAAAVTARVLDLADKFGYAPEGLAYRLKTRDSIASKIDRDTAEIFAKAKGKISREEAQQQAADYMGDVMRFTFLADNGYTTKLKGLIAELERTGHSVRAKNSWLEGQAFRGMNMAVVGPGGERFEIQVHSSESKKLAQKAHGLYDVYRESKDDDQRRKVYNQMMRFSSGMRAPYDFMSPDGGWATNLAERKRLLQVGKTVFRGPQTTAEAFPGEVSRSARKSTLQNPRPDLVTRRRRASG